ncbi:hypothetical protein [Salinimicrobium flavum]|uniref:Secreted protein n=1 Tax=Salinimicrobium flavum TaxID=1737065 RepID=A0ABW5IYW1_9FLAO
MKTAFLTIVLFIGIQTTFAQNLNRYNYVRVPEKFEFLSEENQYQLNALTAFLFEKFGFEALYKEPDPQGLDRCDILQANVHSKSGLFRSRVYVTLSDCNNNVVFTSQTGSSTEKDFKKSFQEALRDAFKSVEDLNHIFTDAPEEIIIDPVVTSEEREAVEEEVPETPVRVEATPVTGEESTVYLNNGIKYQLEKTNAGFDLFKEGDNQHFARLIKSGGGDNYIYTSQGIQGNAYFDSVQNLVVEFVSKETGQLVTVQYLLQDQ